MSCLCSPLYISTAAVIRSWIVFLKQNTQPTDFQAVPSNGNEHRTRVSYCRVCEKGRCSCTIAIPINCMQCMQTCRHVPAVLWMYSRYRTSHAVATSYKAIETTQCLSRCLTHNLPHPVISNLSPHTRSAPLCTFLIPLPLLRVHLRSAH